MPVPTTITSQTPPSASCAVSSPSAKSSSSADDCPSFAPSRRITTVPSAIDNEAEFSALENSLLRSSEPSHRWRRHEPYSARYARISFANLHATPAELRNTGRAIGDRWRCMKLSQVFDPRRNALNVWRLVMASAVVLQHSWPLTGHTAPGLGSIYEVSVDGFFVLSGFLITASWHRNPRPREYFVARALRIFPGLWVCLIVVAFVIAPIGVAIQGGSAKKLLMSTAPIEYVLNNAVLNVYHASIAGTPNGVPWPHV